MTARALAIALAAALLLAGLQTLRLSREQAAHAETRREHAEQMAELERKAREETEAAREEERRRTAEVQKAADEAHRDLDRARADAAAAADAGQRLRAQLAAITSSCRRPASGPAAPGSSPPADAAVDLLAIVQQRLDEAADGIARHADEARAAGRACERAYDSLTPKPAALGQ